MVTPFAWSQPHAVNEHVAGAAEELRRRGHDVVVLAPSNRAADLSAGRRGLRRLQQTAAPRGRRRGGPGDPHRPGEPARRSRRLPGQPPARARRRPVRRRPWARPRLPSLSYLALRDHRESHRRDVPLGRIASAIHPGANSGRSCSRASTPSPRRARRRSRPPRSASPARTSSCPLGVDTSGSRRRRRAGGSSSNGGPSDSLPGPGGAACAQRAPGLGGRRPGRAAVPGPPCRGAAGRVSVRTALERRPRAPRARGRRRLVPSSRRLVRACASRPRPRAFRRRSARRRAPARARRRGARPPGRGRRWRLAACAEARRDGRGTELRRARGRARARLPVRRQAVGAALLRVDPLGDRP